jgi:carbon-monoxide dehydrogenase iron sulfur subunit
VSSLTTNVSRSILVGIPELCTGCRICEIRCAFRHYGQYNPARSRIRVARNDEIGRDVPEACRQCSKCPVIAVCPTSAISRDERTGAVVIDEGKCNSCGLCVDACLFHTVFIDPTTKLALNCDLCGGDPECVKQCPWKAIQYVPIDQTRNLTKPTPPWAPTKSVKVTVEDA